MNFDKNQIKQNFSRAAEAYEHHSRVQRRVARELVSRAGKVEGEVLDIGCGTGFIGQLLEREVVGLDLSLAMCAKNQTAVNADAENLPFKDGAFDFAISSLTIQWVNDLQQFANEAFRVLKTGGKFAFSSFTTGTLAELITAFSFLDSDEHVIKFKPAMQMFAAFKRAGFGDIVINTQTITYRHDDLFAVLNSIKSVGGGYQVAKGRGLKGKKYFETLGNIYLSKFGKEFPVTWQALYITGSK